MANISNETVNNTVISCGKDSLGNYEADFIHNEGNNVTIISGGLNDTIENSGNYVLINAVLTDSVIPHTTAGIDETQYITLDNNNYITNSGNYVTISSSHGDDTIKNSGSNITITSGSGNDTIYNSGENVSNVTITAGAGNDSIFSNGATVMIDGGEGDDFFELFADSLTADYPNPTITTGEGADTVKITTNTDWRSFFGDYSGTKKLNLTLTDFSSVDVVQLVNSVTGFDAYVENGDLYLANNDNASPGLVTLIFPSMVTAEKYNEVKNFTIVNGAETVTIGSLIKTSLYLTDNTTVQGTPSQDVFHIEAKNNVVLVYGDKDTVTVGKSGTNTTVDGGTGDDYIVIQADNNSVYGGSGNDSISLTAAKDAILNGGEGDDMFSIDVQAENPTITGGEGKDTISFVYPDALEQSKAGVVITDLTTDDVLFFSKNINLGSITAEYSDNGLVLTDDKNYFSATLSNTTSTRDIESVTIYTQAGKTSLGSFLTNEVDAKTAQHVMKDFMSSLNETAQTGTKAIDTAIAESSDGRFTDYRELVTAFVNDYINATDKANFFKNYCGIDLTNNDVGAITGYDAGGSKAQISAVDIVPENQADFVSLDEIYLANSNSFGTVVSDATISSESMSFTKNGLTVIVPDFESLMADSTLTATTVEAGDSVQAAANETIVATANAAKNKLAIINGLYSWWIGNSIDLINDSYGISFETEGATFNEIKLSFSDDTLETADYVTFSGNELKINTAKVKDLKLSDYENGGSSGLLTENYYLDRLIAHELTHAVMSANVNDLKSGGNSTYWSVIFEGLAELTQGADDTRRDALNKLVANFTKEDVVVSDIISNVIANASGSLQKQLSDVEKVEYVFGYALLRYFAEQVKESSKVLPFGVRYADNKNTVVVTSLYSGTSFDLANYSNTVTNLNVSSVKKSAYEIIGNSASNSITALPSGGSIYGGAGADTLYGGDGVDYFFYADGDDSDIIYDFATNDFLNITEGTIDSIFADNNDVTVKLANGTIILKDAAGKEISIIDENGDTIKQTYAPTTPQDTTSGGTDTTSGGKDTTSGGTDTVASDDTLKCIDGYYEYTGDHKVIPDYISGERIRYSTDFTGILVGDSDISVQSSTGELTLKNISGKVMEFINNENGRLTYAYKATGAGNIDGSEFSAYEVIMGSPNNANYIAAGSGGSSLWGGGGAGENTLVGGAGDDEFINTGGTDIIQNAGTGDKVKIYPGNWNGIVSGDNLTVTTDGGSITLPNIRNQLIKFVQGNGDATVNVYYAGNGGIVDGRSVSGYQYIVGTTDLADYIYIGGSGGSLWGGYGNASDTLVGNSGDDVFFWGKNDGTDIITNSNSSDSVRLYDVSLADISQTAEIGDNILSIGLNSGTNLFVQSNEDISPKFYLTDSTWQYSTPTDWVRL